MKHSETISEITKALVNFHKEVKKIKKESKNPFFKSSYASLSNILDCIEEPLSSNGLTILQFPEKEFELITRLQHESGEFFESSYTMIPAKTDPQSIGSLITYQRRYALVGLPCLSTLGAFCKDCSINLTIGKDFIILSAFLVDALNIITLIKASLLTKSGEL